MHEAFVALSIGVPAALVLGLVAACVTFLLVEPDADFERGCDEGEPAAEPGEGA